MVLLDSFGRKGQKLNLLSLPANIEESGGFSQHFTLYNFGSVFSGGKNFVSFKGTSLLKPNAEILIECLDSNGDPLFIELAKSSINVAYKEAGAWALSIHVYGDTPDGIGKLILYSVTTNNKTIRWSSDIIIDKSKTNSSPVRFYGVPEMEVLAVQSPVVDNTTERITETLLTGTFHSYAAYPLQNSTKLSTLNVDVDYRIISQTARFNFQIKSLPITLYIKKLQSSDSPNTIVDVSLTSSFFIKDVINDTTLKLSDPFFYNNNNNKPVVTNIVDGTFNITYPHITYNSGSPSYISLNTGTENVQLKRSLAEITYKNIRSFSGRVYRHKVYRKSLFSRGDFEVIADEPITSIELLSDALSKNKAFDRIGYFYNQYHIDHYWFSSSADLLLTHNSNDILDSVDITSATPETLLDGTKYIIAKNDTSNTNRDASYLPFDQSQFDNSTGSNYDSNFISTHKTVQYILSFGAVLKKQTATPGKLSIYFTGSLSDAKAALNYTENFGIKLAEIEIDNEIEKRFSRQSFLFSLPTDLHGTLVIVPYKTNASISDLSLKTYSDIGFSPDVWITRIPFRIEVPNEAFEIKAELFDANSNLIYSGLNTVKNFDEDGDTLTSYMPLYNSVDPSTITSVSGSLRIPGDLQVSQSFTVNNSSLIKLYNLEKYNDLSYLLGLKNVSSGSLYYSSRITSYDSDYLYLKEDGDIKAVVLNVIGNGAAPSVRMVTI
jgi:hypothetical protein